MTFPQLLLSSLRGMWPGLLIWGFLPLVPFMLLEQLRPVGKAPGWRDYGLNILIGLSTAVLALPMGLLAGISSSALHRWLPWTQVHRIHHSTDPQHYNRNFADALPIFDILFGTFHCPARDEFPPTGLGAMDPAPHSIWSAQLGPLLDAARRLRKSNRVR